MRIADYVLQTDINAGEMRQIQTLIQQGVICANMSNYGDHPVTRNS